MLLAVQIKRERAKKKQQPQQQQQPQKDVRSQEQQNNRQATQNQRQEQDETAQLQKPVVGDASNRRQKNPQQHTSKDKEVKRSKNETPRGNSADNHQEKQKSNSHERGVSQDEQQTKVKQGKQPQTQNAGTQSQKVEKKTGAQVKLGIKRARKLQKQKSNDNTASKTTEKSPKSTPFKLPPIPALPPNWTAYKTKAGRQYYHKKGIRTVLFDSNVLLETLAIAMQTRSVWRNVTNFMYILYVTDFQEAKLLSGSDPAY